MAYRALDLFCGAGGAALGIIEAGFEVYGVDVDRRNAAAYPGHFVCGDALRPPFELADFHLVWASPPCQLFSRARRGRFSTVAVNLIPETRELLDGHPFTVIENVPGAPIRNDLSLTGMQVGLARLIRKRHFEMSWYMMEPPPALRRPRIQDGLVTVSTSGGAGNHSRKLRARVGLPWRFQRKESAEAMGLPIHWTHRQIGEAVPPLYAKVIAESAMERIADQRELF